MGSPSAQGNRHFSSYKDPQGHSAAGAPSREGRGDPPPPSSALSREEVQIHRIVPFGLHLLCIKSQQLISFLYSTVFTFYTMGAKLFSIQRQQTIIVPNNHVWRTNCPAMSHKAFVKHSWLELGAFSNFQKNLQCIFPGNRARKCFLWNLVKISWHC